MFGAVAQKTTMSSIAHIDELRFVHLLRYIVCSRVGWILKASHDKLWREYELQPIMLEETRLWMVRHEEMVPKCGFEVSKRMEDLIHLSDGLLCMEHTASRVRTTIELTIEYRHYKQSRIPRIHTLIQGNDTLDEKHVKGMFGVVGCKAGPLQYRYTLRVHVKELRIVEMVLHSRSLLELCLVKNSKIPVRKNA